MKPEKLLSILSVATIGILAGCAHKPEPLILSPGQIQLADEMGVTEEQLQKILSSQLYELSPRETDQYLRYLHATEPDLRTRIGTIAEKNIGQPYELYLLGEAPFEPYDDQPLFELAKSDCVVFSEHTYAMALADNWADFFTTLQHIRYKDGQVGVVTRNHYTELDWNRNNSWLVEDISAEIAGDQAVTFKQVVNKERFFAQRYRLDVPMEKVTITESYVPISAVADIADQLQTGDFVNFIRSPGEKAGAWAGHVGLIKVDDDGTVYVIHSTPPRVRKDNLIRKAADYMESTPKLQAKEKAGTVGFKFLRLQEAPLENLQAHFGGKIPAITMVPTRYDYLTPDQVKEKLERMKEEDKKKKEQDNQSVDQQVTSTN